MVTNDIVLENSCRRAGLPVAHLFVCYGALGLILALLTPNTIFQYQLANDLISLTTSVAPGLMNIPSSSPIPHVVRFYFGIMWLVFPIFLAGVVYFLFRIPKSCYLRPQARKFQTSKVQVVGVYFAIIAIILGSTFLAVTNPYEGGRVARTFYSSRISLVLGATAYNMFLLLFWGGALVYWRAMLYTWNHLPLISNKKI